MSGDIPAIAPTETPRHNVHHDAATEEEKELSMEEILQGFDEFNRDPAEDPMAEQMERECHSRAMKEMEGDRHRHWDRYPNHRPNRPNHPH